MASKTYASSFGRFSLSIGQMLVASAVVAAVSFGASAAFACKGIDLQAHRGFGSGPENSLSSIAAAADAGFSAVEIDVQQLGDGEWVLHHDAVTGRVVAGTAIPVSVGSLNSADWSHLLLRDASGAHTAERPATADSALRAAADHGVSLNIEIKGRYGCRDIARLYHDAARVLPRDQLAFSSVDQQALECLRRQDDGVYLGLVVAPNAETIEKKYDGAKRAGLAVAQLLGVDGQGLLNKAKDAYGQTVSRSDALGDHALRQVRQALGVNGGIHVDAQAIAADPGVVARAHETGLAIYSYGSLGDRDHAAALRAAAGNVDGAIIDGRPADFCRDAV